MDNSRKQAVLQQSYQAGVNALNSQNWDYAAEMFGNCVKLDPDNKLYRQTLRGTVRKKYNDNGSGAKLSGAKLMGVRNRLKKAKAKEEWDTVDQEAEAGLKINPWDADLNAAAAEACVQRGYLNSALICYQFAVDVEKDNKDFLRALAEVHLSKKNFDEAIKCYERVHKLDPLDGEARAKQTEIQSLKAIHKGRYDDAESTTDVTEAATAYEEARERGTPKDKVAMPGDDPIADLQRMIRKDPENTAYHQKLAMEYKRAGKLDKVSETLKQALEVKPGDQNLSELYEDSKLDILRHKVEAATEAAKEKPDDEELKEKRKTLRSKLVSSEIRVFSERVERYPQNSKLKFELAKRYKLVQQPKDAIPLLQQAVADSRLEGEALVMLGECFINVKQHNIAGRQFELALPKLNTHDTPELWKSCHYWLGRLAELKGDNEKAESHYLDILGVDYTYKDVQERLEKLQGGEE